MTIHIDVWIHHPTMVYTPQVIKTKYMQQFTIGKELLQIIYQPFMPIISYSISYLLFVGE